MKGKNDLRHVDRHERIPGNQIFIQDDKSSVHRKSRATVMTMELRKKENGESGSTEGVWSPCKLHLILLFESQRLRPGRLEQSRNQSSSVMLQKSTYHMESGSG